MATTEDRGDFLFACLAAYLAAQLEDTVNLALEMRAQFVAKDLAVHPDSTPPGRLRQSGSLRDKLIKTPLIVGDGTMELAPRSEVTQALHQLVDCRNRLMHVDSTPHSVAPTTLDPDGRLRVTLDWAAIKQQDAWGNVSSSQAATFLEAALKYQDMLSGKPTDILRPVRAKGRNAT